MANSMVHWNGCQVCVIDTETTGLDDNFHEIIQICILPLDSNFFVRDDVVPFLLELKPDFPERVDKEALSVNKLDFKTIVARGIDRLKAIDLLEGWVAKLGLPTTRSGFPKRIIPLGQNYPFDRGFIQRWLGRETYEQWFQGQHRDTMTAALYLNDLAAMQGEKPPFSKVNLSWLCKRLDVKLERAHDALQDCLATAEVYRKLLHRFAVI